MNIYTHIEKYKDYFHSIRLHDSIFLLDLKLPSRWEVKKVLTSVNTTTQIKINDDNGTSVLISFYSPFTSQEVGSLSNDVDRIIKWNTDHEEKNNLLDMKILELRKVFDANNLDSLRSINFDFNNPEKNIKLDAEEPKLVSKGN